jgi:hypothetical protein
MWGALSDERTGLSFTIEAGPRQRHIFLSQIRDVLFRRLLRLAGLGWMYSTPPPRGIASELQVKIKVMLRPTVQSASLSWEKAPVWGLRPDLHYCQDSCRLVDVGRSL